jgi:hypothetical protein
MQPNPLKPKALIKSRNAREISFATAAMDSFRATIAITGGKPVL